MATPLSDATAGAIGSVLANTIVFPLDVVKTRMQVQNKTLDATRDYKSPRDAILKILKTEGVKGLYAGIASGLVGTVVSSFSYFYIYSYIRGYYSKKIGGVSISTAMELTLGAVAGALCQFIVLPIGIVTTRQQTDEKEMTVYETAQKIVKEDGFTELWKGLQASLVLCVNPAITFGVFERIKGIIQKASANPNANITSGQAFMIGALSKALATVVTYPYIMAKVRMQWKPSKKQIDGLSESQKSFFKYKSAWDILAKVYKTDGFRGWYTGMSAQLLKAVLTQAIVFALKEKLSLYTILLFTALRKPAKIAA
ncbi:ADP/ATP carrier protein [Boothiomyces macroporosus]|uniref:ADP/ATP carrier protein n=1 Tax=Boothiomyces macroporosus TaxID=261099 RepID=A0AAD5ULD6_9FUNG|nr:ADP/ATP carrier protein [Boothiomyces macroporosus]